MYGNQGWKSRPAITAALIAGIFILFGLVTLDDFGVTWDEPLHFRAGDLYLERLLDPEESAIFSEEDFERDIQYYGPVFDIWGAINHRIFTVRLSLMPEDNARHLHILISGGLIIFFTSLLASRAFSPRIGFFSGLFLAAFPRFVGHSFNNPKDIPLALVFVVCLYVLFRRVESGKRGYSLLLILAGGVGFATRIQYVVIPAVAVASLIIYNSINKDKYCSAGKRLSTWWDVPGAFLLTVPLGMLLWPYFWSSPLEKLRSMLEFYLYYREQARLLILYLGEFYTPGIDLPWHYVPVTLVVTTPLLTLASSLVGLAVLFVLSGKKSRAGGTRFAACLIPVWIVLGLLPFMLPGQRVYGGIRHFLFVVPALCIAAGAGLDFILSRFRGRYRYPARAAAAILFLLLFISTYSYHPYYTTYHNSLVGGPRGAYGRFSLENWGNAYKAACLWLNRNAPEDSTVLALVAEQVPRWYLRPDITVLGPESAHLPPEHYDYSVYIVRDIDPLLTERAPVFQIQVKGHPICNVHRW